MCIIKTEQANKNNITATSWDDFWTAVYQNLHAKHLTPFRNLESEKTPTFQAPSGTTSLAHLDFHKG